MRSALVWLSFLLCGCSSLNSRDIDQLRYPGFVDVGAGYALLPNTRPARNNDADGFLLSLKAYPFGRWYSKPKSTTENVLSEASRKLAEESAVKGRRLRKTIAVKDKLDEARRALERGDVEECKKCLGEASEGFAGDPRPELGALKRSLDAQRERDEPTMEVLDVTLDVVADEIVQQSEELDESGLSFARLALRLERAQTELYNEEFYSVTQAGEWKIMPFLRRFSFFYGTSIGNFEGGGLDSSVDAVGIGFDLAPQLSFHFGRAFYDVRNLDGMGNTVIDTDDGWIYAVSLNLNAFRGMFQGRGD